MDMYKLKNGWTLAKMIGGRDDGQWFLYDQSGKGVAMLVAVNSEDEDDTVAMKIAEAWR